jgi:hypothetical protein
MRITTDKIEHESRLVWEIEEPESLPYVRQRLELAGTRQHGVALRSKGERIGYALLEDGAPGVEGRKGTFRRRVFYLQSNDRAGLPGGPYETTAPHEAVDPRTLEPGQVGRITERAWGRELEATEGSLQL